jgi:hypothetical protein
VVLNLFIISSFKKENEIMFFLMHLLLIREKDTL